MLLASGPGYPGLSTVYSTLEAGSEKVEFRIKNAGFWVDGDLGDLSVKGSFDPEQPSQSKLDATVAVASMKTGINKRDEHLMQEKYFDQEHFPVIRIRSESIRQDANGYLFSGRLTIKGVTKNIEFPFTVTPQGNGIHLEGSFSLNRLEFNVGSKSFILGNTVEVKLSCNLLP